MHMKRGRDKEKLFGIRISFTFYCLIVVVGFCFAA